VTTNPKLEKIKGMKGKFFKWSFSSVNFADSPNRQERKFHPFWSVMKVQHIMHWLWNQMKTQQVLKRVWATAERNPNQINIALNIVDCWYWRILILNGQNVLGLTGVRGLGPQTKSS
jgi:hypothetical protein